MPSLPMKVLGRRAICPLFQTRSRIDFPHALQIVLEGVEQAVCQRKISLKGFSRGLSKNKFFFSGFYSFNQQFPRAATVGCGRKTAMLPPR
jgi:hypothetical protein